MDRGRDEKQRVELRPAGWLLTRAPRKVPKPSPGVRAFALAVFTGVVVELAVLLLKWALPWLRG